MRGIQKILDEKAPPGSESLCEIRKGSVAWKIIGWAIPIAIVLSIVAVGVHSSIAKAGELSLQWVLYTGGGAMLGTIIAGGLSAHGSHRVRLRSADRPFSAGRRGFFTALVRVYVRPPRVQEFETVSEDIWRVSRWWKNRLTV